MDDTTFVKWHQYLQNRCNQILAVKGTEYPTNGGDRMSNFKEAAALMGIRPDQALGVYLTKPFLAIATFIREGRSDEADREPISGRVADLMNYGSLFFALVTEMGRTAESQIPPPDTREATEPTMPDFEAVQLSLDQAGRLG